MESTKKVTSGSSSSSFVDLFGPKDSSMHSSSFTGPISSVFGPSSTGIGKDFPCSGFSRTPRNQNSERASEYGNAKYDTQDYTTPKSCGKSGGVHSKNRSTSYQNETVQPCYFTSSIYYGGQEVYSTNIQSKNTYNAVQFKKEEGDDDSNGSNMNSASRGNWWQGSLYY